MIQVTDVAKWYGSIRAVENISFSLAPGEIVGFVGPNGAGKSTVLKMLATYILPSSGKITIDGLDVVSHSLSIRRKIGYLSGDTPLYQAMRVDKFFEILRQSARPLRRCSRKKSRLDYRYMRPLPPSVQTH